MAEPRVTDALAHDYENESQPEDSARVARAKLAMKVAIFICFCFMVVEVVFGVYAYSIALITDALHLLTDVAALSLALFATYAAGWRGNNRYSFGFARAEMLAAMGSIFVVWCLIGLIIYASISRVINIIHCAGHTEQKETVCAGVNAPLMFVVACGGLAVNLLCTAILVYGGHDEGGHGHRQSVPASGHDVVSDERPEGDAADDSLESSEDKPKTVEKKKTSTGGALMHALGDCLQSFGVMLAATVIWVGAGSKPVARSYFNLADPLAAIIFSVITIYTSKHLATDVYLVLMETSPANLDTQELEDKLRNIKGVIDIHRLHVWALTPDVASLSVHIVADGDKHAHVLSEADKLFKRRDIHHTTVQLEVPEQDPFGAPRKRGPLGIDYLSHEGTEAVSRRSFDPRRDDDGPEQQHAVEPAHVTRAKWALKVALIITFCALVVEVFFGVFAYSVALLTDALHLLTVFATLALALFATYAGTWAASGRFSYGWARVEVVGAMCAIFVVWALTGLLVYVSVSRIISFISCANHTAARTTLCNGVDAPVMFGVALGAFIVNVVVGVVLYKGGHAERRRKQYGADSLEDLFDNDEESEEEDFDENGNVVPKPPSTGPPEGSNTNAAIIAAFGDSLQSALVVVASIVIWAGVGSTPNGRSYYNLADPVVALIISVITLVITKYLASNVFNILMMSTPDDIDYSTLEAALRDLEGVDDVNQLHVWAITRKVNALSVHLVAEKDRHADVLRQAKMLCRDMHIHKTTVQIDDTRQLGDQHAATNERAVPMPPDEMIRGLRIQIAEIENILKIAPNAYDAAVVVKRFNGHSHLIAYLVFTPGTPEATAEEIDESIYPPLLATTVPSYMIPVRFVRVDHISRSAFGKAYHNALPEPPLKPRPAGALEPESDTEALLHGELCCLFPWQDVSVEDDFFGDLHGSVRLAGKFVSAVRERGFPEFNVRALIEHPSIRESAKYLDEVVARTEGPMADVPVIRHPSGIRRFFFLVWQAFFMLVAVLSKWSFFYVVFAICIAIGLDFWAPTLWHHILFIGIGFVAAIPFMQCVWLLVVIPILKWILLSKVQEGRHWVWSWMYLRWWTIRLFSNTHDASIFANTRFVPLFYRAMGLRVGAASNLGSHITDPDLVELGNDVTIGERVTIATSEVIDGYLHLRRVRIGNRTTIGHGSCIVGGAVIGNDCLLEPQSHVDHNQAVEDRSHWAGNPGGRLDSAPPLPDWMALEPSTSLLGGGRRQRQWSLIRFFIALMQWGFMIGAFAAMALPFGIVLYEAVIMARQLMLSGYAPWMNIVFLAAPVVLLFCALWHHLAVAIMRFVIFPCSVRPGTYGVSNPVYQLALVYQMLIRISQYQFSVAGTSMMAPTLRLLGVAVEGNVEVGSVTGILPGLITLRTEAFISDGAVLGAPVIRAGCMFVEACEVQGRGTVGYDAVAQNVGFSTRIATMTAAPAITKDSTTYMGSPAVPVKERPGEHDYLTYTAPGSVKMHRVLWDLFRVVAGPYCVIVGLIFGGMATMRAPMNSMEHIWDCFCCIVLTAEGVRLFVHVVLKWALLGTVAPGGGAHFSPITWRLASYDDFAVSSFKNGLAGMFRGTPLLPVLFRLLGATLGKNLHIDTVSVSIPDLFNVGEDVSLNSNIRVMTHKYGKRVLEIDHVTVDDRVSIGSGSAVLPGAYVGAGSTLAPRTLVISAERIPDLTHWIGNPAMLTDPPEAMRILAPQIPEGYDTVEMANRRHA